MKMNKRSQYNILAGIGLLAVAVVILLISPSFIFSPTITVIGSNLGKSTTDQVTVATKTDFRDQAQMAAFPMDIGGWKGSDYDTTETAKFLNAPVLLLRAYVPDNFTQVLFLTILQSKNTASFHAPDYCFKSQGYSIQENTKEYLTITDPSWANRQSSLTIPMNKLIVTKKSSSGEILERRSVLYFFVKGNFYYSDDITMVQVQGLVPLTGDYEDTLSEEKGFIAQIFPLMFSPAANTESRPLIITLAKKGGIGYAGIGFILLIPVAVIAYSFLNRKDNS